MTDVTQHLGELLGRSDAEAALDQKAADSATVANAQAPANDATQGVTSSAEPHASAMGDSHAAVNPLLHPDAAHASAHAFDKYAFPFQSHEVFGLLPHSIGSKAESLWELAHTLAGNTSAFSLAVGGILLGAVAVAAVSTARVWRRGDEFAVAGFGDRLTQVGSRYTVRQEAPIASFADKQGVVRRAKAAEPAPTVVPTTEPEVAELETAESEAPLAPASAPAPNTWRARREAQANKHKAARKQPKPERKPEPKAEKRIEAKVEKKPEPKRTGWGTPKPKAEKPADKANSKERERAAVPAPLVAADDTKRPKVVKRQLFKRSSTTVTYASSFHGSYGSFQQTDRLFARDYLKQTNDAFEGAYLKGKGPNLVDLKVGDNHRAERLFMMATRASFEDPQAALAALWQAVDEDRSDAVAWLRLAHFYLELGEFDHARRILEPLQSNGERLGLDIIVAASANSLAKIAAQRGEFEAARKLFAKSLEHAQKTDNPFMLGVASSNAGVLEASRKKLDTAAGLLQRGIKGFELCDERVSAARTKLALGVVYATTGDDEAAERVWSAAQDTFRAAGLDDEAAQVGRWLNGDGTPNAIIL